MKHLTPLLLCLLACLLAPPMRGQDTLRLRQALEQGLANNFSIHLVKAEQQIAENNASLGNAGFLPAVNATASQTYSIQDINQQFITGNENERGGARSNALNLGVALDWVIFDGLGMFIAQDRLNELKAQGTLDLRAVLEQQLARIMAQYYEVVQLQQRLEVLEENLALSQERTRLAEEQFKLGTASERSFLLAKVDENADRSLLIEQEVLIAQSKTRLNESIGREPTLAFEVQPEIPLREPLRREELQARLLTQNPELLVARADLKVAELETREIQAERYPVISVNLGYGFNRSESEAGFLLSNQVSGLNYGITASIPLFNGLNLNRRIQNARVTQNLQTLRIEQVEHQLQAELAATYTAYQTQLRLLELERDNVAVSQRNLDIARQTYEYGNLSAIEFREAQRNHVETNNRLITARIRTKLNEIALLRLSGELGKLP